MNGPTLDQQPRVLINTQRIVQNRRGKGNKTGNRSRSDGITAPSTTRGGRGRGRGGHRISRVPVISSAVPITASMPTTSSNPNPLSPPNPADHNDQILTSMPLCSSNNLTNQEEIQRTLPPITQHFETAIVQVQLNVEEQQEKVGIDKGPDNNLTTLSLPQKENVSSEMNVGERKEMKNETEEASMAMNIGDHSMDIDL